MGLVLGISAVIGMGVMPGAVAVAGDLGSFGLGISGLGVVCLLCTLLIRYLDLQHSPG
jgi:hypothetical protein